MKHKLSITLILLGLFLLAQVVGLFVSQVYSPSHGLVLPFGFDNSVETSLSASIFSFLFSFIFIFLIFSLLMKYNLKFILKSWFFLVVMLSLGITFNAFLFDSVYKIAFISILLALPFTFFKVIKPNIYVHNLTELLIYPGVAVLMTSLIYNPFNPATGLAIILVLLVLISFYDMWAVWKSKLMQKMAKYQIETLNVFGGFLIPTIDKKTKMKIKMLKQKYKDKKELSKKLEKRKFKVNVAILGGGDIVFPIITAGVFMWSFPKQMLFGISGLIPALFILCGAFIGLATLFMITKKNKSYPAMPYITAGILLSVLIWWIFFL